MLTTHYFPTNSLIMENSTSDIIEFSYEDLRSYNIELINDLKEMRERNRLLELDNKRLIKDNLQFGEINIKLGEMVDELMNMIKDLCCQFKSSGTKVMKYEGDITEDNELFDEILTLN